MGMSDRGYKTYIGTIVLMAFLLGVGTVLSLTGCTPSDGVPLIDRAVERWMPPGSESVEILGNGWATFTLEGREFLIFYRGDNMCLTQTQEVNQIQEVNE